MFPSQEYTKKNPKLPNEEIWKIKTELHNERNMFNDYNKRNYVNKLLISEKNISKFDCSKHDI